MPNVSFETKVRSVDLTIQINDISEETANRIKRFITEEMFRPDPFADILVAERDAAKTEPLPVIGKDTVTTAKIAVILNGRTLTRRQKIIRGCSEYAPIVRIIDTAKLNPTGYEWRWTTAKEFSEKWDCDGNLSKVKSVGAVLSGLADEKIVRMLGRSNGRKDRTYYLPFPVDGAETEKSERVETNPKETPQPDTVADRIREYRERSGLGIDEVSDLISFPESVVKAWEAGTNVPSREGKAQLESLFGKHIFDGVQKPVIW